MQGEYESPLVARIAEIRRGILHRAQEGNWIIDVAQLTDQAIIRRMVLKRCIYGVDKNRLTVELAKVSLWLHSFTVGAPLSFLDHHLRCGDSLVGIRVRDAIRELDRLGGLFAASAMAGAEVAAEGMERIEEMSDADVVEVHESATVFHDVEETRPSGGTPSSAATSVPGSTPSTSSSTACPARTPPTSSTPSTSSAARTKPHTAPTAPATSSSPT